MAAAAEAYSRSLQLRPDSASTWVRLGDALRDVGRVGEAAEAWDRPHDWTLVMMKLLQRFGECAQGVAP